MFGFLGGTGVTLSGGQDPDTARDAPPPPTPLSFPSSAPLKQEATDWRRQRPPRLLEQYASIKKPSDINVKHFDALNISMIADVPFHDLIPQSRVGISYLPSPSWLSEVPENATLASATSTAKLKNGRPMPTQKDFHARLQELLVSNEDAYRAINRRPKQGQKLPRLAHFRKFWEGMENMAGYWDTSADKYLLPQDQKHGGTTSQKTENGQEDGEKSEVKQDERRNEAGISEDERCSAATKVPGSLFRGNIPIEPDFHAACSPSTSAAAEMPSSPSTYDPRKRAKTDCSDNNSDFTPPRIVPILSKNPLPKDIPLPPPDPSENRSTESQPSSAFPPGTLYRGHRLSNGAAMPPLHRHHTATSFLEALAWPHGLSISPHRRPPYLFIETLRVPVKLNAGVWRTPAERDRARRGELEGPVLGVRCCDEVNFRSGGGGEDGNAGIHGEGDKALLEQMREIGALLALAQERARQGRVERKPGEGKWYTSRPRWGGKEGGEGGEGRGADETALAAKESAKAEEKERNGRDKSAAEELVQRGNKAVRKKMSPLEVWGMIRPGAGVWDPKIRYEAIGKRKDTEWDDVRTFELVRFRHIDADSVI
ncbi:hypothetical protein LTS18_000992 [Coniosporium uncinatum]|uniref:Uncharacterized protein n=1 Tax=Coniosporium uncinatum TaxID=93489 RepID=A0ACC3DUW6_9PEZI|nr:hypothetical protein LTS18_000992 [Coniosporium uncinatum]